jgi:CheY-like chemotaxis protein
MAMVGKKLLVADDSLTIQKVIRLALSNEGYEIQAVSDGNDAIQQIALFRPDIVLIDVSLPGKTAFEVKRSVNEQEEFSEIRFILMSSAFEKFDEAEAKASVFHGRLTKPFDPAHLRQVISDALDQVREKRLDQTSLLIRPSTSTSAAAQDSAPSLFPKRPAAQPGVPEAAGPSIPPPPAPEETPTFVPPSPQAAATESLGPLITPIAMPIIPAPEPPAEESLWPLEEATSAGFRLDTLGKSKEPEGMPQVPLEPLPLSRAAEAEGDIRHLTESTIRTSGLDDFEWSIQEPLKKVSVPAAPESERPSVETQAPPASLPPVGIQLVPPPAEFTRKPHPKETLLPPPPSYKDLSGATFQLDDFPPNESWETLPASSLARPQPTSPLTAPETFSSDSLLIPPPPPYPSLSSGAESLSSGGIPSGASSAEGTVVPLSAGQMEDLLAKQVEESLEKMVRQLLPDLAERILKQEIHRMLMEQQ